MPNKNMRSRLLSVKKTLIRFIQNLIRFIQNLINTSFKLLFNVLVAIEMVLGVVFGLLGFFGPSLKDKPSEEGTGLPPKDTASGVEAYEVAIEIAFFLSGLVGLGMIFIGALGIVAVLKEQKLVTKVFCIVLICVSVILLTLAVVALVGTYKRGPAFKEYWRPKMINYTFDPEFFLGDVDILQSRFKCCGLSGEEVYKVYPWSCCGEMIENSKCDKDKSTFQKLPCNEAGFQNYMAAAKALGYIGILAALYLIVIVLTVWFIRFKKAMGNEQDIKLTDKK